MPDYLPFAIGMALAACVPLTVIWVARRRADTQQADPGTSTRPKARRLGPWLAGSAAVALVGAVLYQLAYVPLTPASNDEIRNAYGITVFPNPHFTGDTFLMYSMDAKTEGLAEVCDRPSKRALAHKPDLDCYVPGIAN